MLHRGLLCPEGAFAGGSATAFGAPDVWAEIIAFGALSARYLGVDVSLGVLAVAIAMVGTMVVHGPRPT